MMPLWIFLVLLNKICQVPAVNSGSNLIQNSGIITTHIGQNVTLQCFCPSHSVTFLYWYQQRLGGKPLLISTRMRHNTEATIYPAFQERFHVLSHIKSGTEHLVITNLHLSDSATYYCGFLEFNAIDFVKIAFLHVKKSLSNFHTVVHQPLLRQLHSGDSVNLSCTVYTEPCTGEQNLYWFRHGAAQPAIIYHSAGQCMNDSDTHMKTCTSNLTMKSVSSADAGMYYCALASCGETVFGNGTRIEIAGSTKVGSILVYFLSVALALSMLILLVFGFVLYKLKKDCCSVCKGNVSHVTCSADSGAMGQDTDSLHYAALSIKRNSVRHHEEESMDSVCVYSRVRSRKE